MPDTSETRSADTAAHATQQSRLHRLMRYLPLIAPVLLWTVPCWLLLHTGQRWPLAGTALFGDLEGPGSAGGEGVARRGRRRIRSPARAKTTAHTERTTSSGSCMPATVQAQAVPCEPAQRIIPKECETRIWDGPTARRAGSRARSRSALRRRGGRSPRREDATRP